MFRITACDAQAIEFLVHLVETFKVTCYTAYQSNGTRRKKKVRVSITKPVLFSFCFSEFLTLENLKYHKNSIIQTSKVFNYILA